MSAAFRFLVTAGFAASFAACLQPNPPDQDRLLALMRQYAEGYVSSLPNFTCQQTTEQFQAGKKTEHWRQLDSITSKLIFSDGKEHRTLELINGRRVKPGPQRAVRRPLTTEGEFAILISNIFGDESQAKFEWAGWQDLDNTRAAVFHYRITREHSTVRLSWAYMSPVVVAYHGSVFADPATGAVLRVTDETTEIPPELKTESINTVIDYRPVMISGVSYLLPADASVQMAIPSGHIRNDIHFRNYQKFEAASTITFGSEPAPEPKTSAPPPS